MRDFHIRAALHHKLLEPYHSDPDTLVIEELGLKHGSCRADIAIINGQLTGFEIKSDQDSLFRLERQVPMYDAVFDAVTAVVGERHRPAVASFLPIHWGILVARETEAGEVHFEIERKSKPNRATDLFAVTQLLWRTEALLLLQTTKLDLDARRLRRSLIYEHLVQNFPAVKLREEVRRCLKERSNWRDQRRPSLYDDSFQPASTL